METYNVGLRVVDERPEDERNASGDRKLRDEPTIVADDILSAQEKAMEKVSALPSEKREKVTSVIVERSQTEVGGGFGDF